MKSSEWKKFEGARDHFKLEVKRLKELYGTELKKIQQKFASKNPIVYNTALEEVKKDAEIKLILVADNPGNKEQKKGCYLVGPAGTRARNFFNTPSPYTKNLGIYNFDENVIVLNKTPIYTPFTDNLSELSIFEILEESQKKMARILFEFHEALNVPVWIVGLGQMKKGGIFETYTKSLKELYYNKKDMCKQIYFYRHFSYGWFIKDLEEKFKRNAESLEDIWEIIK